VSAPPTPPVHASALRPAQVRALLALRISLGLLMLVWGLDKLVNPAHGMRVAERVYFGLPSPRALMPVLGVAQCALGVLVMLGVRQRVTLTLLAAITGLTLVGVWRSIVDPWGWYLPGTNALFFPSLIIFAGTLVLRAFRTS
jgi:uncharacterized membrane protein YphA (DoxX/SURF4 family)